MMRSGGKRVEDEKDRVMMRGESDGEGEGVTATFESAVVKKTRASTRFQYVARE